MPTTIRACIAAVALLVASAAAPAIAQSDAVPSGSPAGWMTIDDYPAAAWRAEEEGRVSVLLSVDATGRVTDCAVTGSSGSTLLDTTTCSLFRRRARFLPATDAAGTPTAGVFAAARTWRLADVAADRQKSPSDRLTNYVYCYAIEPLRAGAVARRVFLSAMSQVYSANGTAANGYVAATTYDAWRARLGEEGVGDDAKLGCPSANDKGTAWTNRQWFLGRDAPAGFSTVALDWIPPQ